MKANVSSNLTIYDVNKHRLAVSLPSIIYLGILMVIGLVGNILVVIVFGCKTRKQSTYRHFILVLAVYDLTACCIGMPALIYEMFKTFMFYSSVGCKILRFGYHVIASGTSLAHAMIGVDRYRRICRATGTQITVHVARSFSFAMLAGSLVVSIPTIFIYDSIPVNTGVANVIGHKCDTTMQYASTAFPLFYQCLLTFFIFSVAITMIVLYTLMGRKLYQRSTFLNKIDSSKVTNVDVKPASSREDRLAVPSHPFVNRVAPWQNGAADNSTEHESTLHVRNHDSFTVEHRNQPVNTMKYPKQNNTRAREMVSRKLTITTFVIMLVYIGSFVPLMVLELVTTIDRTVAQGMSTTQEALYRLGFLTYAIDNVANPIIYIVMDLEFRKGCVSLFCKPK